MTQGRAHLNRLTEMADIFGLEGWLSLSEGNLITKTLSLAVAITWYEAYTSLPHEWMWKNLHVNTIKHIERCTLLIVRSFLQCASCLERHPARWIAFSYLRDWNVLKVQIDSNIDLCLHRQQPLGKACARSSGTRLACSRWWAFA